MKKSILQFVDMKQFLLLIFIALPTFLLAQPTLTFNPANGASGVSVTGNLTITANEAMEHIGGSDIDDTSVDGLISLMDAGLNAVPFNAAIDGPDKVITINPNSDLLENTIYTLTLSPVQNNSNQATTTKIISFTTGDFTDPSFTIAQAINNTGAAFTFRVNVSEAATVYYVIDRDNTQPDETEVRTQKNGDGNTAEASGSVAVMANTDATVSVSGLNFAPPVKFYVYFFAEDPASNTNNVATRGIPLLNSSSIPGASISPNGFNLRVNVDEAVTTFYVVTQSSTKPTAAQILAGQNEAGGTPDQNGNFAVPASANTDRAITGLSEITLYYVYFVSTDGSGNQTIIETKSATTTDGTGPIASLLSPADGATTVDISLNTFTITFNENVTTINSPATVNAERIRLFEDGVMVEDINRDDTGVGVDGSIIANGASATATITFVYDLVPYKNYYILIGEDVFEDAAGNDFNGFLAITNWNFTASGVVINNATSSICGGSFQSISNIIISEAGPANFNNGAAQTLELSLANTSDFVFSNSGVTVSGLSADVTSLSVSVALTKITVTYTIAAGGVMDNITLAGLKVYATGSVANTTIIRTAGTADQDGNNGTGMVNSLVHATIMVGASAPSQPQLAASQDLIHCVAENITSKTLTLVDQGPAVNYSWYSDISLSNLKTSSTNETVNIVSDLQMTSPAVAGTYKFYVVAISACQSAPPFEVIIQVSANPVANAGADLTGASAICTGETITLGGNPTLQTPSAPGSYTYGWQYVEGTPEPNAEANPVYSVSNNTGSLLTYNFEVTITDTNGCAGTDTKTVEVKSSFDVSLTSPNSYVFSPSSPNQTLVGSPAGGVFSGVGVVQSNASTYQFSPVIAHATDPNTLPKNFPIYYTITSGGCTVSNVLVATFTISNSFFSTLQAEYCSNEYPNPTTAGVDLSIDLNGYNYIDNRKINWNTNERFYRGPFNNAWQSFVLYPNNAYVRYSNEIYRCNILLGCSGFTSPDLDAQWALEPVLKVKFDGLINNYYEDYYGGNTPGSTVVKSAATYIVAGNTYNSYTFGTNVNYNNCINCNYAYPAAYLEFERPEDIQYILPAWFINYYYYRGDLATYNGQVYLCNADPYTVGTQPDVNPALWTNVTSTDYGNGQYYHKFDASIGAFRSGFYVNGQFVQINKNPTVFFSGLANGDDVCEFNVLNLDNAASSVGNIYGLTGNFSNQNLVQDFSVRLDGSAVFNGGSGTITNDILNPGKALFDTRSAFSNSSGGAPNLKNIEIQYKVNPGSVGSTSQPCYGTSSIIVKVLENSNFDFDNLVVDPQGAVYCYTEAARGLRSRVGATLISGNAGTPNSVIFSGYGVSDLGNSRATFTPGLSIEQLSPGTTVQQSIPITATYRDVSQCLSTRVMTFNVNPDIDPSFTFGGRANYCYEDITNSFTGHFEDFTYNSGTVTSSGKYEFFFKDPGGTNNLLQTTATNNTSFTAKQYYDQIQNILISGGFTADLNQAANVNVIYTETLNAGKLCSESYPQTMVINAPLVLDIFGLDDGDILCRNDNSNVSQGNLVTFEGSVTGSGIFNLDDDTNFSAINPTLNGTVNSTSGKATINLLSAYNAASDASDPRQVYLQYQYTGAGCTGPANVFKGFEISPPPALSFDFSAGNSPPNGEIFCYDETPVQLTTIQNTNVILSGYGIKDDGTGNGVGIFNPELAYNTSISNGGTINTQQNIVVNASIVDGIGCANARAIQYNVNPIPQATLITGSLQYCYEDPARTLQGQQTKSWFAIEYQGVTTPFTDNIGDINNPQSSVPFDPQTRFDNATNDFGASTLTPVNFNVYYSVADNNNCTNTIGPFTIAVANQIDVVIAGLDNNDVFCSNETNGEKVLSFNPFPADASKRTFTINGQNTPLSNDKYTFIPGLSGGNFKLKYVVISGNNCTNTDSTSVKILPSPEAIFSVLPACEGDLINFNANGSGNLSNASYTWAFNDSLRSGQNLQHRFPAVDALSSYGVQLKVQYPAFNNDPALVCRDSLRLDQIVGPVPKMDFNLFNVCESDQANFESKPNIPISRVSWDFGDSNSTPMGFLASAIPATPTTTGTFQLPIHTYAGAGEYEIIVTGRTADIFGGCIDTETRTVSILKNWTPTAMESSYDMSRLDGGKGFWVKEDLNGNTSWEFNTAAKQNIKTNEMAWVTGPTLPYKPQDVSYVNSPCFDLSTFSRPVLSLKHWTDTEPSDGAVLQYSIDGGENWVRLGNVASGLDWYNRLTISANPGEQTDLSSGWSFLDQNNWAVGKHTLDGIPLTPGNRSQVRFRVAFASFNNRENRDGFAFNNFVIEERNRTILVENFTNLVNVENNNAYKKFRTINGNFNSDELVKLQYHGASALVIVAGLHLLQTALWGSYKKPRELVWWIGILLLLLVLAFAITGYVLRWDQSGYWANQVEVGIAAGTPVVGASIKKLAIGGND
ncbi:MAG: cytochrome b N-terminal domain-containing protein, partial [Cyclobacteriaceae bacterium]